MSRKNLLFFLSLATMLLSCSDDDDNRITSEQVNMRIDSYTVDCVGEAQGQCLLVQEGDMIGGSEWDYFYFKDSIEGFLFEPGYIYDLIVKKTPIENPPQDSTGIAYKLIEIVSKTEVTSGDGKSI